MIYWVIACNACVFVMVADSDVVSTIISAISWVSHLPTLFLHAQAIAICLSVNVPYLVGFVS
jgi:uncharacterized membrane protein